MVGHVRRVDKFRVSIGGGVHTGVFALQIGHFSVAGLGIVLHNRDDGRRFRCGRGRKG